VGGSLPTSVPNLAKSLKASLRASAYKLRRRLRPNSDLDQIIPPEIVNDEFYEKIRRLAQAARIRTMLEIGSSTGEGSTRAFVEGMHDNPNRPTLFCLEVSRWRFQKLQANYERNTQVRCYNMTSVPIDRFPTEADVIDFYRLRQSKLNVYPLGEILRWLREDIRYVNTLGPGQNGIQIIKDQNNIDTFDMVLIDGSEFTGLAELDEVYGAHFILLDDIGTFKNLGNYERLRDDPTYQLLATNAELRNGYAVFERRDQSSEGDALS
jgi:hypothetical protein